jgi:hypothetical protein
VTRLRVSDTHGGAGIARIEPGGGTGGDPLELATGVADSVSSFLKDDHHTMPDKDAFFEMVYGRLVQAVQDEQGGAPNGGWVTFRNYLSGYSTVFIIPVEAPPPAHAGAWSVANSGDNADLRAFVIGLKEPTNDPNGIGGAVKPKWGIDFQSFDPAAPPDGISRLESDTRTWGHELGHTLGLGDQYPSAKFDPTIQYIGGLDLMGSSQSPWPHFCAYHKFALGWYADGDRILLQPPAPGDTETTEFILVPTEWWDGSQTAAARNAFAGAAGLPVGVAAICDLGGTGGVLATIEARAPTAEFSQDMDPDSDPGRVMVLNILDYSASGRYGQVIADVNDVPQEVVDGLLRYRRRLHKLAGNLQSGDILDMEDAPGFPFPGIVVEVLDAGSITIGSASVPVYRCQVEWTGGVAFDVGFADNDEEWRSSDIAIDYLGDGEASWPDGEPVGVGESVVIPTSGPPEPHRVLVRVRNFGTEVARNVEVELYLRDPGGGGELNGDEPYRTEIIEELLPESEAGPLVLAFPWDVPVNQEPHVCWRAQIGRFEVGEGGTAQTIVTDASVTNNWAQQNIFEADVTYASPPAPLVARFSVGNDGPFVERAKLVPQGLPEGVTLRVRPRILRVPAYSRRSFSLRFEFDEALVHDRCRREMNVLLQCLRFEEHFEEPWGASLFNIRLKRQTDSVLQGSWFGNNLTLEGDLEPPVSVGHVRIRLDFDNGQAATWVDADLSPGGTFDAAFSTAGVSHGGRVYAAAYYSGTDVFAPCVSPVTEIHQVLPAG